MSANATGTPTALGIPKFNTASDAPNGKGVNEMMDALDSLLSGHYMTTTGDLLYASAANTPARLAVGSTGQVLTVSGGLPAWTAGGSGAQMFYDQITAPVSITSSTESSGTAVISAAAHVFDGTPVYAEFFSPACQVFTSETMIISLFEGSTQISRFAVLVAPSGSQIFVPVLSRIPFTPSAASHTYTVTATRTSTNVNIQAGPLGTAQYGPAYLRFIKA